MMPVSSVKRFWAGYCLAILGAIFFSAKGVVVKMTYLYDGVDAVTIIGFRMLLSGPVFLAVAAYQANRARKGLIPRLTVRQRWQIVLLGFIGYYLASFLAFLGLQTISAGLERVVLYLSPTFVLLITALYFKRPIALHQWLALAFSYAGVVFVFLHDLSFSGPAVIVGAGFVLASALSYSVYLIGSAEIIKVVGATRLVAYAMSVSAAFTIAQFFWVHSWEGLQQPWPVYQLSLIHATLNTVAPTFMIMWAVARIGAPLTSQLGLIGPVSVLFLAAWLLGEPVTALQLVGTAFVLTGVIVLGRGRR
ncbi:MAG: EamA family transporter [Pusillimonas sp.]|nr:EamA family transporter [Pusillimonas sp.]MBC41302.1 EamA family transporter [Pusillimonas sp.]HCP78435.1 EamA family transporter [Pusillimonas sp.]|tara:strand:- start:39335 stop:40252 length:918 start_codon:yes stop_codon:yes gene_type:complete